MPLGRYPDFNSCVEGIMEKKGFTRTRAKKYCGIIRKNVEIESKIEELEKRVKALGNR